MWSTEGSRWLGQDCGCARVYARSSVFRHMHSQMYLCVCTAECIGWRVAWHFLTHGSSGRATRIFIMHSSDGRAARLFVVHGLVGTCPRFGRNAQIGCTQAKLYGHDWAMWLVYRNVHMQLKGKGMQQKVEDMQLKVSMQKNIGERGSRGIYVHSLLL